MKKNGLIGLVFCVCLGSACWSQSAQKKEEIKAVVPKAIKSAPNFNLPDEEGKKLDLQSLKGNVVLVHFWASWCAPCIDEIPEIVAFAKTYADNPKKPPLKLVLISLDTNWKDSQKIYTAKGSPANVYSVIDVESETSDTFGSFQFPETYVLNKELKIVTKWVGPQKWENPYYSKQLEALL